MNAARALLLEDHAAPEPVSDVVLWRGRRHLGDDPDANGNASFVGLASEWPLTIRRRQPKTTAGELNLLIEAERLTVYASLDGHRISVARLTPARSADQIPRWQRQPLEIIGSDRLTGPGHELSVELPDDDELLFLVVRLEFDTAVALGVYEDFVVSRLVMRSTSHTAALGFDSQAVASLPASRPKGWRRK